MSVSPEKIDQEEIRNKLQSHKDRERRFGPDVLSMWLVQKEVVDTLGRFQASVTNGSNAFLEFDKISVFYRRITRSIAGKEVSESEAAKLMASQIAKHAKINGPFLARALSDLSRDIEKGKQFSFGIGQLGTDEADNKFATVNSRNNIMQIVAGYFPPDYLSDALSVGTTQREAATRLYSALTTVMEYSSVAPDTQRRLKHKTKDQERLTRTAHHQMLNYYLYLHDRGFTSYQIFGLHNQLFGKSDQSIGVLGVGDFLNKFNSNEVKNFSRGLTAELLVALDYLGNGYQVELADDRLEAMAIDLVVHDPKSGRSKYVQVKGESSRTEIEFYELPRRKGELKGILRKKYRSRSNRYIKDVDYLIHTADSTEADAEWAFAPSRIDRLYELWSRGELLTSEDNE